MEIVSNFAVFVIRFKIDFSFFPFADFPMHSAIFEWTIKLRASAIVNYSQPSGSTLATSSYSSSYHNGIQHWTHLFGHHAGHCLRRGDHSVAANAGHPDPSTICRAHSYGKSCLWWLWSTSRRTILLRPSCTILLRPSCPSLLCPSCSCLLRSGCTSCPCLLRTCCSRLRRSSCPSLLRTSSSRTCLLTCTRPIPTVPQELPVQLPALFAARALLCTCSILWLLGFLFSLRSPIRCARRPRVVNTKTQFWKTATSLAIN